MARVEGERASIRYLKIILLNFLPSFSCLYLDLIHFLKIRSLHRTCSFPNPVFCLIILSAQSSDHAGS